MTTACDCFQDLSFPSMDYLQQPPNEREQLQLIQRLPLDLVDQNMDTSCE